ncbi:TetR family transcriptional regulator [Microbacterium paludicola]|uniref:TetR family transcriptional regulator n=1 Tax=Microbacterium paludicola TaxID=300019 RepID=A0A4Y9G1P6_9MICO|nr:TetR family transcriptional regulator [Microbacterium paludicola]TFU34731.1 TetR family transcriptional regulator [Microbacterium paludicola]
MERAERGDVTTSRAGRPKASSREMLAEAASELFLEQGYEATSIAEIAARAGVSRSSFFNYAASKGALLWGGLDERLDALDSDLERGTPREAVREIARGLAPDALALALANAEAMGLAAELEREAALRRARIGRSVARALRRRGLDPLAADVAGAAYGGAVIAALERWALAGPGRVELATTLDAALEAIATIPVD